jgi:putative spermidine/putrescine transport system ATP-binding protein
VALARAFAPRPRLLLLDEPLSALDAALRSALRDELAALLRQFGITAIFVTHDQDEAMAIADRVAVMCQGRVEQIGTPEVLYRSPENAFVARFVGNSMPLGGYISGANLRLPGGVLTLSEPADGKAAFVRAEDVKIADEGTLVARVETVTFLGTHYRIALSGAADETLFCLHQGLSAPNPGETVRLSIAPQSILTLNPEKAAA